MPRLSFCLLLLSLAACNPSETSLRNGQQPITGDDDDAATDDWDDDDSADGDCWDEEICVEEFEASDACWDALGEDPTEEELDACFDVDEALFECFDDEYPIDDDEFAECEDELEAADTCWDGLDEDASDADIDACMVLEEALWECAGYDLDEPVEAYDDDE